MGHGARQYGQGAAPSEICLAGTLYVMHESVQGYVCVLYISLHVCRLLLRVHSFLVYMNSFPVYLLYVCYAVRCAILIVILILDSDVARI